MTTESALFGDTPGDTVLTAPPDDYAMGGERRWLRLDSGPERGRKLYFSDQMIGDAGANAPVILLVHGNPESSYTYRKVVADLRANPPAGGARVVVPDHIGFGLSDQARHEMVDMHHAANLIQLVEALDLHDICLVVHDWGGPIGIGALLLNAPERVTGLMVLNTTVFPMPSDHPTYTTYPIKYLFPWTRSGRIIPDALWGTHAAFALGVKTNGPVGLARQYAGFVLRHRSRTLPPGESPDLAVFRDQFASRANARSSKRMVRQTGVWGHGYAYTDPTRPAEPQDNHAFYRSIQDRLPALWGPAGQDIPVAAVFGGWDPCGKPSVRLQWVEALPQLAGHLEVFEHAGHFIEESRPAPIAAAVRGLCRRRRPGRGVG